MEEDDVECVCVLGNKKASAILEKARAAGIPDLWIASKGKKRAEWDAEASRVS